MSTHRHFIVAPGKVVTLPIGLVEGATHTRVFAGDYLPLEHARIAGSRGGSQPYGRFIEGLKQWGDIVEVKAPPEWAKDVVLTRAPVAEVPADPAPAIAAPSSAPAAVAPPAVAEERAPEVLSPADHARLAKETTP